MAKQKMSSEGVVKEGKLNEIITVKTRRSNGSLRIQQDFEFCPSMAEQHTGHLTDINFLMKKYQPDELQVYINSRAQYRHEILGHDFSIEPDFQNAKNLIYTAKQEFLSLPEDFRNQFKSFTEFLKYVDNPANAEKLVKLGVLTPTQLDKLQSGETAVQSQAITTTTQEEDPA